MISTLTRIGIYERPDFEQILHRFSTEFRETRSVLGTTRQYMFYEENKPEYLVVASRSIVPYKKEYGYNVMVTVTSEMHERNLRVMSEISARTSLALRETTPEHAETMSSMNIVFPVFKRVGKEAIKLVEVSRKR